MQSPSFCQYVSTMPQKMGLKETASAINGGNSTIKIVIEETPFISHGPSSCSSGVFDHFLMWVFSFSFHFFLFSSSSLYVMLTALYSLVNKNLLQLSFHFPSSFVSFINQCNAIDWECKKNFFVSSCVDGDCYFWILRKLLGSLK